MGLGGLALALSLAWTPAAQATGGRISGVVIAEGGPEHGEPLSGVTVRLTNRSQTQNRTTDERGEFTFVDLLPGRYRITTLKEGYGGEELGAFPTGGEGTPVEVENARTSVHVMAKLRYPATLRGTVLTEDGAPAADVRILAMPIGMMHPDRPRYGNETTTDLAGAFTVLGAPRGEIVIAAIDENRRRPARFVAYFPGTADPGRAERLTIRTGEDRELPAMKLAALDARLVGVVTLPDGAPASGASITIQNTFDIVAWATTDAGGRFEVPVAAGKYRVIARHQGRPTDAPGRTAMASVPAFWTAIQVEAAAGQTAQTTPALQPVASLSGRVATEGDDAPVSGVEIAIRQRGTTLAMMRTQNDRFEFDRVVPGEYGLTVQMGPESPWWLKSVAVNGRSLLSGALVLESGQRQMNAVLTLSRDRGELSGFLTGRNNLPQTEYWAAVIPTDESVWQPDSPQIVRTRPATNGRFLFERLPAGEYALAVFGDLGSGEWRTPAILKSLVTGGIKVTVAPGASVQQNVQIQR